MYQFRNLFTAFVVAVLLVGVAPSAQAERFGVRVLSIAGEPMVGVAVCIGTHGSYRQFAAQFTPASGVVYVDVPNVPLVVTVSKDRFSSLRVVEPARRDRPLLDVRLREGVPGPRCRAGSSLANAPLANTVSG